MGLGLILNVLQALLESLQFIVAEADLCLRPVDREASDRFRMQLAGVGLARIVEFDFLGPAG